MDQTTVVMGRPGRGRPPVPRSAAAIIAAAAAALLAAACGGSPAAHPGGTPGAGGTPDSQLVSFARCMRSHGVPDFPDPQPGASNEKVPTAAQLSASATQLQAAQSACQHLLPAGTDDRFPPAEVPFLLRGMLPFARCMRSHGVPNFPDPASDPQGRPYFPLSAHGISLAYSHSPQFTARISQCQRLHPPPRQLGGIPFG
ncbi:MAG TPA: hypothetical protein VGM79_17215 [Streptosporangiaceae bacterium]|jgi:hypothetical protein